VGCAVFVERLVDLFEPGNKAVGLGLGEPITQHAALQKQRQDVAALTAHAFGGITEHGPEGFPNRLEGLRHHPLARRLAHRF
jgi:hypothetical protein